jgi:phage terminase large subunit-like protein
MQERLLEGLSVHDTCALPWLWDFWAMAHQRPPEGDWRTWVVLGGRGAGKTRAGAEWVRGVAEGSRAHDPGRARRIALVGETIDQAREVMVMGDSGILACCPPDRRPSWIAGRNLLRWPNGAEAQIFSAHSPETLRGPQFDAAWADEMAKWPKAAETWDMLGFALRLGRHPRICVTTTPRACRALREVLDQESTVSTHAPTDANAANLAPSFIAEMRARHGHGRLARQELDGLFLDDIEGALWPQGTLADCLRGAAPPLDRVVVAVDPSVSVGRGADEVGIIVAGVEAKGPRQQWRGWVLEDVTVAGCSPSVWMARAVEAYRRHGADRLVAEVNQGGDLVREVLAQVDPAVAFKPVHVVRDKSLRAEPVAVLYEQGRVFHAGGFPKLEDQMAEMSATGFRGRGSPDRVDALVWALTELMLGPASGPPRARML